MKTRTKVPLVVVIALALVFSTAAIAVAAAPAASERPLSDFLMQQGTFDMGFLFVPPVPNYLAWGTNVPDGPNLFGAVDYAGLAYAWMESQGTVPFETTFSGKVIERPLADGRAFVSLVLHTHDALTWIFSLPGFPADSDWADAPTVFGYRPADVLAGQPPALADSLLKLDFINSSPGAELPDLLQLFFVPGEGQEMRSISFQATARGTMTETGERARADFGQVMPGPSKAGRDGWPGERIQVHPQG